MRSELAGLDADYFQHEADTFATAAASFTGSDTPWGGYESGKAAAFGRWQDSVSPAAKVHATGVANLDSSLEQQIAAADEVFANQSAMADLLDGVASAAEAVADAVLDALRLVNTSPAPDLPTTPANVETAIDATWPADFEVTTARAVVDAGHATLAAAILVGPWPLAQQSVFSAALAVRDYHPYPNNLTPNWRNELTDAQNQFVWAVPFKADQAFGVSPELDHGLITQSQSVPADPTAPMPPDISIGLNSATLRDQIVPHSSIDPEQILADSSLQLFVDLFGAPGKLMATGMSGSSTSGDASDSDESEVLSEPTLDVLAPGPLIDANAAFNAMVDKWIDDIRELQRLEFEAAAEAEMGATSSYHRNASDAERQSLQSAIERTSSEAISEMARHQSKPVAASEVFQKSQSPFKEDDGAGGSQFTLPVLITSQGIIPKFFWAATDSGERFCYSLSRKDWKIVVIENPEFERNPDLARGMGVGEDSDMLVRGHEVAPNAEQTAAICKQNGGRLDLDGLFQRIAKTGELGRKFAKGTCEWIDLICAASKPVAPAMADLRQMQKRGVPANQQVIFAIQSAFTCATVGAFFRWAGAAFKTFGTPAAKALFEKWAAKEGKAVLAEANNLTQKEIATVEGQRLVAKLQSLNDALAKSNLKEAEKLMKEAKQALQEVKAARKIGEDLEKLTELASKGGTANATGAIVESHHLLPRQFARNFKSAGIDINEYLIDLEKTVHRLKPGGLHTIEGGNWNKVWKEFFAENPNRTKQEILDKLAQMLKDFGLE